MELSDKQITFLALSSFAAGFAAGITFTKLRKKWLETKKGYLERKLNETKHKLDST